MITEITTLTVRREDTRTGKVWETSRKLDIALVPMTVLPSVWNELHHELDDLQKYPRLQSRRE